MSFLNLILLCAAMSPASSVPFHQSGFEALAEGAPAEWRVWAARPEIAPRTFVDITRSRGERGSLAISGNHNAAAYGGWERTLKGVEAGKWYRFSAYYQAEGLSYEPLQAVARLCWETANGEPAGRPDYPYSIVRGGGWTRLSLDAQAPEKSGGVTIQLYLQNAPSATLWWDEIDFQPIAAPGARLVTVASINYRPGRKTGSASANVKCFIDAAEKAVPGKVDVILFPEGAPAVDTGLEYAGVAEPIPGPITRQFGELAKRKNAYVVAGIYEREGAAVYNTSVLIDRQGQLAGKYRKVYIPREEIEVGITPGSEYPVYETDFGRIGMMICWDSEYPEPARALALKGAELILMPIWDGEPTLVKARAIENHLFLVESSYGSPTQILDPEGKQLALAPKIGTAAVATIDLNRRYKDPWLGDMRARMMKEYRGDIEIQRPDYAK
jgi:predicted amidohydrolase